MIRYFSGNNPLNVILLFFTGILIRLPHFITPVIPQPVKTDGLLYIQLMKALQPAGAVFPVIYPLIAYVLLFTQAVTFNGLINNQKLFPTPNYLLALTYLLVTSVVPQWNVLSPVLIINTVLVWAWPGMVGLFNSAKPKSVLFNIGFGFAVCSFFYTPSVYLLLLLFVALILFRPFYLTEWLIAILGVLTPYYFLLIYLFVWNKWKLVYQLVQPQSFRLPQQKFDWIFWTQLCFVGLPLIIGFLMSLRLAARMLVQIRKSWRFMMFYLVIALLIPFINCYNGLSNWILAAVPVSLFHAVFYYYPRKKRFPEIIFWLTIAWIIANYLLLN